MKVILASSNNIGGILIRLFTFSKWNHSALYFEDENIVVDAIVKGGVRVRPYSTFAKLFPKHIIIDVDVPDYMSAKRFALAQVGKPYDWTAIISLVLQRKWDEEDSWFCSELVEATIKAGGRQRFRAEVNKITPQQNWAVI